MSKVSRKTVDTGTSLVADGMSSDRRGQTIKMSCDTEK